MCSHNIHTCTHTHTHTHNMLTVRRDVFIRLTTVIISPCTCILNNQVVHLEHIQFLLKRKNRTNLDFRITCKVGRLLQEIIVNEIMYAKYLAWLGISSQQTMTTATIKANEATCSTLNMRRKCFSLFPCLPSRYRSLLTITAPSLSPLYCTSYHSTTIYRLF